MARRRSSPAALLLLPLVASLLAGCARRRAPAAAPEDHVFTPDQVALAPQLLGCTGYTPVNPATANARVEFQFVVDRNGGVVPNSAVALPSRQRANNPSRQRPSDALVQSAREALLSCTYQPALHAGTTVAVRMRRTLLFAR
jgi:hypothetical protein